MIGDYLGGMPTMKEAQGHPATSIPQILDENLKAEKTGIEQYKKTYKMIIENKSELPFVFEKLEHDLRHIIMDEQEHITELDRIKGV
jgi:bacterioferritin (cytochrome b1)